MSYHSTSKDNIFRHNISYNFAFGSNSLSLIFLKIFEWPIIFVPFWSLFWSYLRNHSSDFAQIFIVYHKPYLHSWLISSKSGYLADRQTDIVFEDSDYCAIDQWNTQSWNPKSNRSKNNFGEYTTWWLYFLKSWSYLHFSDSLGKMFS